MNALGDSYRDLFLPELLVDQGYSEWLDLLISGMDLSCLKCFSRAGFPYLLDFRSLSDALLDQYKIYDGSEYTVYEFNNRESGLPIFDFGDVSVNAVGCFIAVDVNSTDPARSVWLSTAEINSDTVFQVKVEVSSEQSFLRLSAFPDSINPSWISQVRSSRHTSFTPDRPAVSPYLLEKALWDLGIDYSKFPFVVRFEDTTEYGVTEVSYSDYVKYLSVSPNTFDAGYLDIVTADNVPIDALRDRFGYYKEYWVPNAGSSVSSIYIEPVGGSLSVGVRFSGSWDVVQTLPDDYEFVSGMLYTPGLHPEYDGNYQLVDRTSDIAGYDKKLLVVQDNKEGNIVPISSITLDASGDYSVFQILYDGPWDVTNTPPVSYVAASGVIAEIGAYQTLYGIYKNYACRSFPVGKLSTVVVLFTCYPSDFYAVYPDMVDTILAILRESVPAGVKYDVRFRYDAIDDALSIYGMDVDTPNHFIYVNDQSETSATYTAGSVDATISLTIDNSSPWDVIAEGAASLFIYVNNQVQADSELSSTASGFDNVLLSINDDAPWQVQASGVATHFLYLNGSSYASMEGSASGSFGIIGVSVDSTSPWDVEAEESIPDRFISLDNSDSGDVVVGGDGSTSVSCVVTIDGGSPWDIQEKSDEL